MNNILLISENYVKENSSLNNNAFGKLLLPSIRDVQEISLMPIIGEALFNKICRLIETGDINAEPYAAYKDLLDNKIRPYLLYATLVDVIPQLNVKLSNMGSVLTNDEHIVNLSQGEADLLINKYQEKADFYCKRLQDWIKNNQEAFPELKSCPCLVQPNLESHVNSVGLWLGGERSKKHLSKNCGCDSSASGSSRSYDDGFEDGKEYQKSLLATTAFTENGVYEKEDGWNQVAVNVSVSVDGEKPYLYEMDYNNVSYDEVRDYFESLAVADLGGGCSALYRNGKVLRSYDWFYNYQCPILVRTANGTMGIASKTNVTVQSIESGLDAQTKQLIPFYMCDGMNRHGLVAEMNVVPAVGNTETHPEIQNDRICAIALVRYILDTYKTVNEAVEGLQHIQIFFPQALIDMGYEVHYLLGDSNKSVVIEIIENELVVINQNKSTNFHINGVNFKADGSVYTNVDAASGHYPTSQNIELYANGLERWNILNNAGSKSDIQILDSLKYSQSYTKDINTDFWYSEFVGTSITVDTPYNNPDFINRINVYKEKWAEKTRSENTVWISVHQCVYDTVNKEMKVRVQENDALIEKIFYPTYADGYDSGITYQKSLLSSTTITLNGNYTSENGWNAVNVNISQTGHTDQELIDAYNSGHTDGITEQKAKLTSTSITSNGTYTREDGWNQVAVNVPSVTTQSLTQAQYDALPASAKTANIIYLITG